MAYPVSKHAFDKLDQLASSFSSAAPFPHVVIDDFLDERVALKIHDEARLTAPNVDVSNDITQRQKLACNDWSELGEHTWKLISYFNSAEFIGPLEKITGIDGLFGDPWLDGGGIHIIRRGGFLKMHTDFNWSSRLRSDRRLNILYYLNRGWVEGWGGELQIERLGEAGHKTIAPLFNRLVIFNTNDSTLHGHPAPLAFPEDYPRASVAMYYYSTGLPVPERIRRRATTTRFLPRGPGDIDLASGSWRARLGYLLRRFTRW